MKHSLIFTVVLGLIACPLQAEDLSNNTAIDIEKSWSQEPSGWTYPMAISVPNAEEPAGGWPICILLHGFGGNGQGFINQFRQSLECHVLVAPTGYLNCWNICTEPSEAPDTEMVGDLIDQLQTYDNINPKRIQILGVSNGSALANSVLIENDNPGLTAVASIVSQLSEFQFHDGDFYCPSGETDPAQDACGYDTPQFVIPGRRYITVSNVNDFIPYFGGPSSVGVDFLPAQLAAYYVAVTQGYQGEPITGDGVLVEGDIFEYVYLDGEVVHLRGFAQHGINPIQEAYVVDFLNGCEVIEECPGDVNGDQEIDVVDILQLIGDWGQTGTDSDVDGDGDVDTDDLLFMLSVFGEGCG
ncbi:MAG: hypothetical protein MK089_12450 [Phycisphaerales bacterium]|nr:hypothetical protein [Phycisphaerales bacterium]